MRMQQPDWVDHLCGDSVFTKESGVDGHYKAARKDMARALKDAEVWIGATVANGKKLINLFIKEKHSVWVTSISGAFSTPAMLAKYNGGQVAWG